MKYLPPRALGNRILRSRSLPRPRALPRIGNLRGGAIISRPDGASQRADQRVDREHVFPVETRLAASRRVSEDGINLGYTGVRQSLHKRAAPCLGVGRWA